MSEKLEIQNKAYFELTNLLNDWGLKYSLSHIEIVGILNFIQSDILLHVYDKDLENPLK